jgi:hypothetical protein
LANRLDILDKIDKFLHKYDLPILPETSTRKKQKIGIALALLTKLNLAPKISQKENSKFT